jgi:hypothetical protein
MSPFIEIALFPGRYFILCSKDRGGFEMKVAELSGAQLDYWAAKCMGFECVLEDGACLVVQRIEIWHERDGVKIRGGFRESAAPFMPSTDWSQGGPIIDRERIKLTPPKEDDGSWAAQIWRPGYESAKTVSGSGRGHTPLIAAMRAFVASKFGDEVEELAQGRI